MAQRAAHQLPLEFLDLFFEDIAALIDRTQPPIFLDKETTRKSRNPNWKCAFLV